jgi:hypothetical protein
MDEPLRYETLTGLSRGQLAELTARVGAVLGDVVRPEGGRYRHPISKYSEILKPSPAILLQQLYSGL